MDDEIKDYFLLFSCRCSESSGCIYQNQINKILSKNKKVKCICRHDSLRSAKDSIDLFYKDFVFVVNAHHNMDNIAYWQLGYAMGKGNKALGLNDGKNDIILPEYIREVIHFSADIKDFYDKIESMLTHIDAAKRLYVSDWDKEIDYIKKNEGKLI